MLFSVNWQGDGLRSNKLLAALGRAASYQGPQDADLQPSSGAGFWVCHCLSWGSRRLQGTYGAPFLEDLAWPWGPDPDRHLHLVLSFCS